jgi:hypothetical protein
LRWTSSWVKIYAIISESIVNSTEIEELLQRGAEIWISSYVLKNKINADDKIFGMDKSIVHSRDISFFGKNLRHWISSRNWHDKVWDKRKYEQSSRTGKAEAHTPSTQAAPFVDIYTTPSADIYVARMLASQARHTLFVETFARPFLRTILNSIQQSKQLKITAIIDSSILDSHEIKMLMQHGAEVWVSEVFSNMVIADRERVGLDGKIFSDSLYVKEYMKECERTVFSNPDLKLTR